MFGDDDEGKSKGDLVKFGKKVFIAIVFIVAAPTIVAPLMGVDINSFCTVGEDEDCHDNVIFSTDVTNLVSMALNAIRIGGAIVVIVAFGIKGIQYQFVQSKDS